VAAAQQGERDAAGVEVDGVLQVPGRGGAALALPLVRRAVVPHALVDHELVAALEQVQERDRAVGSDAGDRVSLSAGKRQRLPREERMKGDQQVQLRRYDRVFDAFDRQTVPVAVELRTGAELLPAFEHPEHALYVFGPEDGSLRSAELSRCHRFVVIPTRHCVNLASAVYLVLYDRMVKRQALGLDPVLPIDQVLAEQRGFLEPDSMAPSVGVMWGDQEGTRGARP